MNMLRTEDEPFISNVAQYAGNYRGVQQGLMCWEVRDPDQAPFKNILEAVCLQISQCRSIPLSTLILIDIFLRGRTLETCAVYVMLGASIERQRKTAIKHLRRSSLLKDYPGLKIDHWDWPPQSPNIILTGGNGEATDAGLVYRCPSFEIRRHLASGSAQGDSLVADACLFSVVATNLGQHVTRTGTLSSVMLTDWGLFLIAPAHIFMPLPPETSSDEAHDEESDSSSTKPLRIESATPPGFDRNLSSSQASQSTTDDIARDAEKRGRRRSATLSLSLDSDPNIKRVGDGHQFSYRPSLGPEQLSPRSSSSSDMLDDSSDDEDESGSPSVRSIGNAAGPAVSSPIDHSDIVLDDAADTPHITATSTAAATYDFTIEHVDLINSDDDNLDVLQPTEIESNRSRSTSRHGKAHKTMVEDLKDLAYSNKTSDNGQDELSQEAESLKPRRQLSKSRRISIGSKFGKRRHIKLSDSEDDGEGLEFNQVVSSARRMLRKIRRISPLPYDLSPVPIEELEQLGTSQIDPELSGRQERDGFQLAKPYQSSNGDTELPNSIPPSITSSEFRIFSLEHDYALIAIDSRDTVYSKLSRVSSQNVQGIVPGQTAVSTMTLSQGAVHGSLDGRPTLMRLPYSSKFSKLYPVTLSDPVGEGDCGSAVADRNSNQIYGFVVAASVEGRVAYIVSADEMVQDAASRLG
ncbi:hypothetical protein F66182_4321 [Fusarium sp. NRRL 66182]|nr:hypothetical protein F66182_4321 [Fusarium sp. NRRL 66182]